MTYLKDLKNFTWHTVSLKILKLSMKTTKLKPQKLEDKPHIVSLALMMRNATCLQLMTFPSKWRERLISISLAISIHRCTYPNSLCWIHWPFWSPPRNRSRRVSTNEILLVQTQGLWKTLWSNSKAILLHSWDWWCQSQTSISQLVPKTTRLWSSKDLSCQTRHVTNYLDCSALLARERRSWTPL